MLLLSIYAVGSGTFGVLETSGLNGRHVNFDRCTQIPESVDVDSRGRSDTGFVQVRKSCIPVRLLRTLCKGNFCSCKQRQGHQITQLVIHYRHESLVIAILHSVQGFLNRRAPPFSQSPPPALPSHLGNYTHSHENIDAPTYSCVPIGECDVCTPFEKVSITREGSIPLVLC